MAGAFIVAMPLVTGPASTFAVLGFGDFSVDWAVRRFDAFLMTEPHVRNQNSSSRSTHLGNQARAMSGFIHLLHKTDVIHSLVKANSVRYLTNQADAVKELKIGDPEINNDLDQPR